MKIIPVIMAGGAGTRLWPLSREDKPKQFHNLSGEGTLLEETIKRLLPINPERIVIVTARRYEELAHQELNKFSISNTVLSEPRPRNTAAAVLYAACYLDRLYDDSLMIILPADHYIKNNAEFVRILKIALEQAVTGKLVTIGIKPDYPETGYGYIKAVSNNGEIQEVDSFVEKPDLERATEYFKSGRYYWNSGIFAWKTSVIMEWFKNLLPVHHENFLRLHELDYREIESNEEKSWKIKQQVFNSVDPVSIDFGILENARNRIVIPGKFGWADLGSWKAIDGILPPDENQNRTPDREKAVFVDSTDCSAFCEGGHISVVGLSHVVVVEAGGEIMVIDKDSSQDVRKLVEIKKKKGAH